MILVPLMAAVLMPPQAPVDAAALERGLSSVTVEELLAHASFLADDALGGRNTPSPGLEIAAAYLSTRLDALGLEPIGDDGTYYQRFPVSRTFLKDSGVVTTFAGPAGDGSLAHGEDIFLVRGWTAEMTVESGPVVYVGTGSGSRSFDAAKGAWALVMGGDGPNAFPQQRRARRAGALGVLVARSRGATEPEDLSGTRESLRSAREKGRISYGEVGRSSSTRKTVPVLRLSDGARDRLIGVLPMLEGQPVDGLRVSFHSGPTLIVERPANVVGLLRGSDPDLAREAIVFSAHMDHVGTRELDGQPEVWNGADDNASGTSALLEIAGAFAEAGAPARSVIILFVSGEEKGLWGSSWYVEHPLWPLEDTVCNINTDMVGRNAPNDLMITPSPRHGSFNTVAQAGFALGASEGFVIRHKGIKPNPGSDAYFGRSDHANFARKGIPVCFFFADIHEDYHGPHDTWEKLDLDKMRRVARLSFRLGWQVANDPKRPVLIE